MFESGRHFTRVDTGIDHLRTSTLWHLMTLHPTVLFGLIRHWEYLSHFFKSFRKRTSASAYIKIEKIPCQCCITIGRYGKIFHPSSMHNLMGLRIGCLMKSMYMVCISACALIHLKTKTFFLPAFGFSTYWYTEFYCIVPYVPCSVICNLKLFMPCTRTKDADTKLQIYTSAVEKKWKGISRPYIKLHLVWKKNSVI